MCEHCLEWPDVRDFEVPSPSQFFPLLERGFSNVFSCLMCGGEERALLGVGPDSTLMCIVCFSVLMNVVNTFE